MDLPEIKIPIDITDAVAAQQRDVDDTKKECRIMKSFIQNIVASAMASPKKNSTENIADDVNCSVGSQSTSSSSCTLKTIKSVESIDKIDISDESPSTTTDSSATALPPDFDSVRMRKFLDMVKDGAIELSDEIIKELYDANTRIDDIQNRCANINDCIGDILSDINNIQQYFKIDNALLHGFKLLPKTATTLDYCIYVANQLNYYLKPYLPIEVKWEHISTAHWLPTKAKKSKVIVVRFCNRSVRDAILKVKHFLPPHLNISEHLTSDNLDVLKKAQELFGKCNTHTSNCKVIVNVCKKDHVVTSVKDVHKLFVNYCELIGSNDSVPVINFSSMARRKSYASVLSTSDSVINDKTVQVGSAPIANTINSLSSQNRTVRCKFFNPEYAAVLEKNNPVTINNTTKYNKNRHRQTFTSNKYSGRTYYRHQKGHGRW